MRTVSCFAIACILSSSAAAQTPTDKIKLEVNRAELQIIGQGLMELPYKTSASVLMVLQQQLKAADQATADTKPDTTAPKGEQADTK